MIRAFTDQHVYERLLQVVSLNYVNKLVLLLITCSKLKMAQSARQQTSNPEGLLQ